MSKPDDRRDNVDKLQETIDNTIENMRLTEEAIAETDNAKTTAELEDKNKRRQEALESLRSEIRDEAIAKKNGYK
ncbi:small acid-soluble spore protein Tlp [Clostridium thermarum]|uniref:small acid-soluble spore protein Tlp n=1 Tax=Clostridium thermarum TaxID=1716543 RepID=UPI0013D507B1|nr:small acid-soluble spore protein Tlp [Clostridium thermarum]